MASQSNSNSNSNKRKATSELSKTFKNKKQKKSVLINKKINSMIQNFTSENEFIQIEKNDVALNQWYQVHLEITIGWSKPNINSDENDVIHDYMAEKMKKAVELLALFEEIDTSYTINRIHFDGRGLKMNHLDVFDEFFKTLANFKPRIVINFPHGTDNNRKQQFEIAHQLFLKFVSYKPKVARIQFDEHQLFTMDLKQQLFDKHEFECTSVHFKTEICVEALEDLIESFLKSGITRLTIAQQHQDSGNLDQTKEKRDNLLNRLNKKGLIFRPLHAITIKTPGYLDRSKDEDNKKISEFK